MTVEEVFNKMAAHMREGLMYHDEMGRAYDFLGLYGYSKCQEYHYLEESKGYKCLCHYYATHYFKLLEIEDAPRPKIIPDSWYKYTTMAVDTGTKRSAVKELMEKWIKWEQETKKLYEELYGELTNLREIAAACYVKECICEVDNELKHAQKKLLKLETLGYDIGAIIGCQQDMYRKFKKLIG